MSNMSVREAPNRWDLLVCVELYQLRTVEERVSYYKESKCCYACGRADLSSAEESDCRHRRCDYANLLDRDQRLLLK